MKGNRHLKNVYLNSPDFREDPEDGATAGIPLRDETNEIFDGTSNQSFLAQLVLRFGQEECR